MKKWSNRPTASYRKSGAKILLLVVIALYVRIFGIRDGAGTYFRGLAVLTFGGGGGGYDITEWKILKEGVFSMQRFP